MITRMQNELGLRTETFKEVLEAERKCREGLRFVAPSSATATKLWAALLVSLTRKSRLEMEAKLERSSFDLVFSHCYPENDFRPDGYLTMARSIEGRRIEYLISDSMKENPYLLRFKRLVGEYTNRFAEQLETTYPEQVEYEIFVHEYDKFILSLVPQTMNTP